MITHSKTPNFRQECYCWEFEKKKKKSSSIPSLIDSPFYTFDQLLFGFDASSMNSIVSLYPKMKNSGP